MAEIVPAVMPYSLEDLREKMSRVVGIAPFIQIDIMDGQFVPSKSWPYSPGGPQEFSEFANEGKVFPYTGDLHFSADLMVKDPIPIIDDWVRIGASRVIVHIESLENVDEFFEHMRKASEDGSTGILSGIELGFAIDVATPNEVLEPYTDRVDIIQCMGIEKVGYQGEPFDERVLEKVAYFKKHAPEARISVDGGVNFNTAKLLVDAGADILVSGSVIFESNDIVKTIEKLKAI